MIRRYRERSLTTGNRASYHIRVCIAPGCARVVKDCFILIAVIDGAKLRAMPYGRPARNQSMGNANAIRVATLRMTG